MGHKYKANAMVLGLDKKEAIAYYSGDATSLQNHIALSPCDQ